jgi:hypothetical protein
MISNMEWYIYQYVFTMCEFVYIRPSTRGTRVSFIACIDFAGGILLRPQTTSMRNRRAHGRERHVHLIWEGQG